MSIDIAKKEFEKRINRPVATALSNLCTRCGWCVESCHIYQATKDPALTPVGKTENIRRVYRKSHDWMSQIAPWWNRAKKLDDAEFEKWADLAFQQCTLCERCTVNCPVGVDTAAVMSAVRSTLTSQGKAPEILEMLADSAISKEESMDFYRDFFLEQVKEMETTVQETLNDPAATIPVDKEGAKILFVPLAGAHTIVPPAIIFNAVKESWTLSMFEAANYAVFIGDTEKAKKITNRLVKEVERLGVKEVVLGECGHAYTTLRWEAPKWFGGELPFRVRSVLEVLDEYLQQGKLKIDPSKNPELVTYHDSCNLGRKGGLFEQPRRALKAVTTNFKEMYPNRVQNFCCGGGSGLVALDEFNETRIKYGKVKADQIRETEAKIVVTSCDNCRHQIKEIAEHYDMDYEVLSLSEMVVKAMVVPEKAQEKAKSASAEE